MNPLPIEIQNIILNFLDEVEQVAAKLVCRGWSLLLTKVLAPRNYVAVLAKYGYFGMLPWTHSAGAFWSSMVCANID